MSARSPISAGLFSKKSFKGGGCDCCGRTPSGLPLLQCGEFGWHPSGNEGTDCLGLTQVIGLPPSLETENDRSGSLLRHGCFVLLGKESFECRSGDGLRGGARTLPLLEGSKLYWQAAVHKREDRRPCTAGRFGGSARRSRDERESDSFGRRRAIQNRTYPDSQRSAGCAVRQPLKSRSRYCGRPSILLRSLAARTIDLTDRELSDILEGLDNAIECMADWSDDEINTARDRRDIRRKTRKFWRPVKKLIVYAPNHYMAVSVKGASRGSGATVTLNGTELGSNGAKPVATKLTNNGAGTHPP
jgi:hypothetical protein